MKLVLIAYNEAIDEEVMECVNAAGLKNYTKWAGALGSGSTSGPHLRTHVWPKGNNVLAVAAEEQAAKTLMEAIRRLRQTTGDEGVKAFLLPIEDLT